MDSYAMLHTLLDSANERLPLRADERYCFLTESVGVETSLDLGHYEYDWSVSSDITTPYVIVLVIGKGLEGSVVTLNYSQIQVH